ncbi:MAG TPA: hypothetical protein VIM30_05675 [Candidatus Limnocylindrales bacterium]
MDQQTDAVRVRGSFERNRTPAVLVAVLVACIALAVVKPWSADHDASSGAGGALPSGVDTSRASPSASPRPPDPNVMSCMSSEGGRVLTLVRWPGHEVRTWQSPGPAIGKDPLDPSLVPLQILSSHVIGIGVCAFRPNPADSVAAAADAYDVVAILGDALPVAHELGPPVAVTQEGTIPRAGVPVWAPRLDRSRRLGLGRRGALFTPVRLGVRRGDRTDTVDAGVVAGLAGRFVRPVVQVPERQSRPGRVAALRRRRSGGRTELGLVRPRADQRIAGSWRMS